MKKQLLEVTGLAAGMLITGAIIWWCIREIANDQQKREKQ